MEKLNFIVNWGKNKETAWSGTNYSIFKALSKFYDINEFPIKSPGLLFRILRRLLRMDSFRISSIIRRFYSQKYRNLKGNTFQFGEICQDTADRNTFIYLDLNVSYIKYMYENLPSVFAVSAYQNVKYDSICKRSIVQDKYLKTCSAVFTMGHWLKDYLVSNGFNANNIYHVGGGYNVRNDLYNPQKKSGTKILFVGKDFNRKGGIITYEAFKILKSKWPDVELYVSGPVTDPIENPNEGYHFMGQLPFDEVANLYNKCDIFCMPSYFEAYGLVFVEALSFGLPCIGRNCYEMPYFIEEGQTGLLLKNEDANELAALMERLLKDEKMKENVKAKRDYYLKEYSWDSVALRMKKVIEQKQK